MNAYIAAIIGAVIFGIIGMTLMYGKGIKLGEQMIWAPGDGTMGFVSYRKVMIVTMLCGAGVGFLFYFLATH